MSNSTQSTRPVGRVLWEELLVFSRCPTGRVLTSESETSIFWTGWVLTVKSFCQFMGCRYETDWVNIIRNFISLYYSLMFFIAYTFKGREHEFAGQVKIVNHRSCRTSAILKYFCPLKLFEEPKQKKSLVFKRLHAKTYMLICPHGIFTGNEKQIFWV